ncbi:MAG: hypothetical protein JWN43_319 [Gammaproteobacteria bacterium]|nr:hypothetical protein [Gammaproteobacteria bacterium]
MSAIFMSVPRALHVAFILQAYENAPESSMARILRWHVEECDVCALPLMAGCAVRVISEVGLAMRALRG